MRNPAASELPAKLIRTYRTRDPFRLARELDIHVMMRSDFGRQKGAFALVVNVPFIFINDRLSDQMQRIVCAHELGHALLHRALLAKMDGRLICEMELFDIRTDMEYEANAFAAGLLIDETQLEEYIRDGYDMVQMARALDTNVNLLMIRMIELRRPEEQLDLPFIPERDFLGHITDSAG